MGFWTKSTSEGAERVLQTSWGSAQDNVWSLGSTALPVAQEVWMTRSRHGLTCSSPQPKQQRHSLSRLRTEQRDRADVILAHEVDGPHDSGASWSGRKRCRAEV